MNDDMTTWSRAELLAAGFGAWDESGLLLIPIKLYSKVKNGTSLLSINGEKTIVGQGPNINMDTRAGLLAWGWIAK